MEIHESAEKNRWNTHVVALPHAQFLQSWEWGEFQRAIGREVARYHFVDGGSIIAAALCVRMPLPFGRHYWLCPRGPVITNPNQIPNPKYQIIHAFTGRLRGSRKALFVRIEPIADIQATSYQLQAISSVHPKYTRIINLSQSEDELLAAMHHKWRYNIRLAQKKEVEVREMTSEEGIAAFLRLNKEMKERQGIVTHADGYYEKMVEVLGVATVAKASEAFLRIYVATYQGKPLASAINIYFGDTATYVHGASTQAHKNVMAPHLLQWKMIRDARDLGYRYYDFFGINPDDTKDAAYKKSWEGITRFKAGFGGEIVGYPGTFDVPVRRVGYAMYRLVRRIKR